MALGQGPERRGPTRPQIGYPSAAGGHEVRKGWPGSHRIMAKAKLEVEAGKGLTQRKARGEHYSRTLGPQGEQQRYYS